MARTRHDLGTQEPRNVFLRFGPWPELDEVDRFRSSDVLRGAQQRMAALLDSFETRTPDEVTRGG